MATPGRRPSEEAPLPSAPFEEHLTTTRDGLRIYSRHYRAAPATGAGGLPGRRRRPVVCLPGITRNSRDFHVVASALATDPTAARDVYTLDMRGRGRSDRDPDPQNYAVLVEMLDVLDVLAAHELSDVAILGTSRGGLIAMVLAAASPAAVGAVVMNDIGPVLELDGLTRIAGYVGRTPVPHSWPDAARLVRDMNLAQFPRTTEAEWAEIARQIFDDRDGAPALAYDPALSAALSVMKGQPPAMWEPFQALTRVPLLVLRGELSDLLSAATVAEMGRHHPRFTAHTVRWQGHAPWLRDRETIEVVARFFADADRPA
jgi:pimeloyl-ACP methyl ester carboxylesterase